MRGALFGQDETANLNLMEQLSVSRLKVDF